MQTIHENINISPSYKYQYPSRYRLLHRESQYTLLVGVSIIKRPCCLLEWGVEVLRRTYPERTPCSRAVEISCESLVPSWTPSWNAFSSRCKSESQGSSIGRLSKNGSKVYYHQKKEEARSASSSPCSRKQMVRWERERNGKKSLKKLQNARRPFQWYT